MIEVSATVKTQDTFLPPGNRMVRKTLRTPTGEEIIAIISEEARIDAERLQLSSTLASLNIASLDVMSVLFAVEEKYGVEIAPEDLTSSETLGQLVDAIRAKVEAA